MYHLTDWMTPNIAISATFDTFIDKLYLLSIPIVGTSPDAIAVFNCTTRLFILFLVAALTLKLSKLCARPLIHRAIDRANYPLLNSLKSSGAVSKLFHYVPVVIFLDNANLLQEPRMVATAILTAKLLFIGVTGQVVFAALNGVLAASELDTNTRSLPIKTLTQFGKVLCSIVCFIIAMSIIIDKSPAYLLGSLGAISAILILTLRDTIIGVVAGIQVAANKLVRIGDRIEVGEIEGVVEDISLTLFKIRTADNNVISYPTTELIYKPLKNLTAAIEKGQRIYAKISIDPNSIELIKSSDCLELFKMPAFSRLVTRETSDIIVGKFARDALITNAQLLRFAVELLLKDRAENLGVLSHTVRQIQQKDHGIVIEVSVTFAGSVVPASDKVHEELSDLLMATASLCHVRSRTSIIGK